MRDAAIDLGTGGTGAAARIDVVSLYRQHLARRGFVSDEVVVFLTGNDAGLLAPRLELTHRTHPGLGLYGAALAASRG